jgi:hypothetical protein
MPEMRRPPASGRRDLEAWIVTEFGKMTRNKREAEIPVSLSQEYRCACCDGVIEIGADRDVAVGLSLPLGLVSDECALICNGCTARLIAARQAQKPTARGS